MEGGGTEYAESSLTQWLKKLPRGTAVFVANDKHARTVLDTCENCGIKVPGELAVLGVDNEVLLCKTANPPLSSVAVAWEDAGYLAAEALDGAMRRERDGQEFEPPKALPVGPKGIVARASTNELLANDVVVRRAMELINAENGHLLSVTDLVRELRLTRRSIELHFTRTLGCSPYEAIQRVRLEHVKSLARDVTLSSGDIAYQSGFSSPSHLFDFFKRRTGQTLDRFRKSK